MKYNTVGLHFKEWTHVMHDDDDCWMLRVADIDVAVSIFIIFSGVIVYKSL